MGDPVNPGGRSNAGDRLAPLARSQIYFTTLAIGSARPATRFTAGASISAIIA